ncbi:hypothetical protein SKAU_G00377630 [Synaphobranchus kaupii]|uniref:Uncharacterized protein n=1 Tax=Synaphobranchus kaupii TaxID=118154 RepID=A0A9Q1ED20_SYNKA|nr:hypothetical protein SKAU_G00377630 [Synaphobranchus kaupii]
MGHGGSSHHTDSSTHTDNSSHTGNVTGGGDGSSVSVGDVTIGAMSRSVLRSAMGQPGQISNIAQQDGVRVSNMTGRNLRAYYSKKPIEGEDFTKKNSSGTLMYNEDTDVEYELLPPKSYKNCISDVAVYIKVYYEDTKIVKETLHISSLDPVFFRDDDADDDDDDGKCRLTSCGEIRVI